MDDDRSDPVAAMMQSPEADDIDVAQSLARLRGRLFSASEGTRSGLVVSRYRLDERLGAGAHGTVYAAHDPELGRRVAIKLIEGPPSDRLLREARALAGLAHPNVVTVHDAGAYTLDLPDGRSAEGVFIVMELLEGTPLDRWLADTPSRSWRRIVPTFVEAARGLEAVHAAGLVHRDFKASNVLRAEDGRICLTDFGLAWPDARRPADAMLFGGGTPAFMAPEQQAGGSVDARADQWSFCAALFEALFDRLPYAAKDAEALLAAKKVGPPPMPSRPPVPRDVRRMLRRGLAPSPAERLPDMSAVRAALERPFRLRRAASVGALVSVVGAAAVALTLGSSRARECADPDEALAGIWDAPARQAIRSAFAGSGIVGAEKAGDRVIAGLDRHAREWVEAHRSLCELGSESSERGQTCLDRRVEDLRAASGLFASADAGVVARSADVLASLYPAKTCLRPPTSAGTEASEAGLTPEVAGELARARLWLRAGRFEEAGTIAEHVLDGSATDRSRARALVLRGEALSYLYRHEEAERILFDAVLAAERAGDERTAVEALVELVYITGKESLRFEAAEQWARLATAKIAGAGLEGGIAARLAHARGVVEDERGRPEKAITLFRQALELCDTCPERSQLERDVERGTGRARAGQGRWADAQRHFERVREMVRRDLGPEHPTMESMLLSLGWLARTRGDLPAARRLLGEALRRDREGNWRVPLAAADLSMDEGKLDEAEAHLARAAQLVDRTGDARRRADIELRLGRLERLQGRPEDALRRLQPVHERIAEDLGSDAGLTLALLEEIAEAYRVAQDFDECVSAHQEVLDRRSESLGAQHPRLGASHRNLGRCLAALGRRGEAKAHLRRALELLEPHLLAHHPQLAGIHTQLAAL